MSRSAAPLLLFSLALLAMCAPLRGESTAQGISVQLYEGIQAVNAWPEQLSAADFRYRQSCFAFVGLPRKYNARGVIDDRSNPLLLHAEATIPLAAANAGGWRVLLRAKGAARLQIDGKLVAETQFMSRNGSGHEAVPELAAGGRDDLRPLPAGCQERVVELELDSGEHRFELAAMVGGKGLRLELDELCVALSRDGGPFKLLTSQGPASAALTDAAWASESVSLRSQLSQINKSSRAAAARDWSQYWDRRHEVAREVAASWPAIEIPQPSPGFPEFNQVDRFVNARLAASGISPAALTDDHQFLRRLTLDTLGLVPSRRQISELAGDVGRHRRVRAIDRLLDHPGWADHWVSYWQDVLAENPGILKPKLNNSGPFRWWIHESFLDNKPFDRFVTELVMMEGSKYYGGPAGFGMATQNDVPSAAKAHILAKAFLGLELKCARCHDAPYHPFKQRELFSLAAMLHQKPLELPQTSTVPTAAGARKPMVDVSLQPGDSIRPDWPFSSLVPASATEAILPPEQAENPRARLAATFTSPHNRRFAQVVVNRIWKRYLGRGLVEPVDDWPSDQQCSHPELLDYLAREFVTCGYDFKHVARLILNSHVYQRRIVAVDAEQQPLFATPVRRRMTAEQLVDSLFAAAGKSFASEPLTLDPEGRRSVETFLNLGAPTRAWQFTSLSNERDRPALALPVAQSILDLLVMFGWRDARPHPLTERDETATVLQPLTLANGIAARRAVRLCDDSSLTQLCLQDITLPELIEQAFLQILSRPPSNVEQGLFVELLVEGYEQRIVSREAGLTRKRPRTAVSWSNHLSAEATRIKLELERAVQAGDPPTTRLDSNWRERMEDMLWALFNSPEFVFVP